MNNTFLLKKQDKFSELPLSHFVTGIKQIKLILLDLHPEFDSTVLKHSSSFKKKKKIAYCRVSSKKQADDLERQKNFLIMSWLQTLALGLIGKEKDLKPFTHLSV